MVSKMGASQFTKAGIYPRSLRDHFHPVESVLLVLHLEHHLILLRREDLKCNFCGSGITTEMLHYLFDCAALSEERRKLNDKTGQLCPSFPALINEISKNRLTSGFHRRAKANTSFEDDDVPIDDTTTKPLFTPQENGRKGTRDKVPRLRWNPWQKHVKSTSVLRYTRNVLPHLAHLCLISTFLDDGLRMIMQWNDQIDYLSDHIVSNRPLSVILVIYNIVIQLGCSIMVLLRIRVPLACSLLSSIVIFQLNECVRSGLHGLKVEVLIWKTKKDLESHQNEKWVHYDRATYGYPGHASSSTAKPNIHDGKIMLCIWWDQLGVVYYELLQMNERITGEVFRRQLMRLSEHCEKNGCNMAIGTTKLFCNMIMFGHMPHHLLKLKWEVLSHPPYSPDIAPSDYYFFRSMQHGLADQHFSNYDEDKKKWINEWIAAKELSSVCRFLSLMGALLFLYVETWVESKSTFAGVPQVEKGSKARSLLQLVGRILMVLMFTLTLPFHSEWLWWLRSLVSGVLILLVAVGYKTRLSATLLVLWMAYLNLTYHAWWNYSVSHAMHDFLRYEFFQMTAIVGGLLLLVALGPGRVLRYTRNVLPHLAHLCLISTFLDDGLRMIMQWNDQIDYLSDHIVSNRPLSVILVIYNIVIQLGCSIMVLLRIRVPLACSLLSSIVIFQ
ncbi:SURF4, partial [Cordylochernes scorpioides]